MLGRLMRMVPKPLRYWEPPPPPSVVLLLKEPVELDEDALRLAGKQAFQVTFSAESSNAEAFLVEAAEALLMNVRGSVLSFLGSARRIAEDWPGEDPLQGQSKTAWENHRACLGIDCIGSDAPREHQFALLARISAELVSGVLKDACIGVYWPEELEVEPNSAQLADELRQTAQQLEASPKPEA